MRIYVVRHGEIQTNIEGIVNAQNDLELTSNGIQQCKEIRDKYRHISFDVCYSSGYKRTIATAKIITGKTCPIIVSRSLRERECGIFEGKHEYEFPEDYFLLSKNLPIEGGAGIYSKSVFVSYLYNF